MTPPRYSQFLAANLTNASLEIIPEAGHMVMLEKPRPVAHTLLNFLEEVSRRI
jgi:pimeloyl-ACP methyl ester carboxylesterase